MATVCDYELNKQEAELPKSPDLFVNQQFDPRVKVVGRVNWIIVTYIKRLLDGVNKNCKDDVAETA